MAPRDMDMLEPVFHGGLPAVLWKNMFQAYGVKGAIDLAAGEGEVCKAAILLRKPCVAFCFTDLHVKLLFSCLVDWMLMQMAEQDNIFYDEKYQNFISGQAAPGNCPAASIPRKRKRASSYACES